jgi:hypothetical protein
MDFWHISARRSRRENVRNEIIREKCIENTILDDICAKQLVWYGHLQRMDEDRLPQKILIGHLLKEGKEGDQKQDGKKAYSEDCGL